MTGRATTLLMMLGPSALALSTIAAKPAKRYIWNASASVPVGLYRLRPTGSLWVTELVAAQPSESLVTFLSECGYLPAGVPMLKCVMALPGDLLQRAAHHHRRQHRVPRGARARQPSRPLPAWLRCRVIAEREVLLNHWQSADSLDERYFAVLPTTAIVGRADPPWTNKDN